LANLALIADLALLADLTLVAGLAVAVEFARLALLTGLAVPVEEARLALVTGLAVPIQQARLALVTDLAVHVSGSGRHTGRGQEYSQARYERYDRGALQTVHACSVVAKTLKDTGGVAPAARRLSAVAALKLL
jgi:hypothetical protein